MSQNFRNHTRYVPVWHFVTGTALLALLAGSIRGLLKADESSRYPAALLVLVAFILLSVFWYVRAFALKAQDRAIRAEEALRHYLLTGKPMDSRLRLGQIIALRFASDAELPELTRRAVEEKLSARQIKEAIREWKADYHRV